MKKTILFSLFIFIFLFLPKTNAWGLPKSTNGQRPYPGKELDELIKRHNSFYIGEDKNEIYLTFDTGYELGYTSKILDTLSKTSVKAAFFVTGHFLQTEPDLVRRMHDEGHLVCNHTYHHYDITKLGKEKFQEELALVEEKYYEITNQEIASFLRPPEGSLTEESLKITDELGYTQVFWSLAYVDWRVNDKRGKDYAYRNVLERIHNGAIILLHTVSKDNMEALEDIIIELKKTYEFKTLYDLIIE